MKKTKIEKLEDISPELRKELIEYFHEYDSTVDEEVFNSLIPTFDDFIDLIFESSDHVDEKIDYDYIYHTYQLETETYILTLYGDQYLKDQCICDLDLDRSVINVINKDEARLEEEKKKQIETDANRKKWEDLFKDMTKEELFDILKDSKFPLSK